MKKKDFFEEQLGKTFEEFYNECDNKKEGNSSTSASSGNYSTSASSGDYSKSASSGNYSKSASSGNYSSATTNGFFATVKGEGIGCLISAVEFNKDYQPIGAAWGIVGIDVEANKEYIAHNGKLKEYIVVDGIRSILLSRKANVMKVLTSSFETLYVVTKDGYSAHGKTLKQANEDVNFKIASEKLKNEPILEDTIVTVKHYRLITGACEVGVKSWMQENQIEEGLTAKELLPVLERTNAYGVAKFKSLISWG